MNFEEGIDFADEAVFVKVGRRLSEVELGVLEGAWQGQTYDKIADRTNYAANYLKIHVGPALWKTLSEALGEPVTKNNLRSVLERQWRFTQKKNDRESSLNLSQIPCQVDWGDAPNVSAFYGRDRELSELTQWIASEQCRLVALLGMGGIGKTALSAKLAQQLTESSQDSISNTQLFDFAIWRSLRNAPPLETLIADLVSLFSRQQEVQGNLSRLLYYLRTSRCLVFLDNYETVLQSGNFAGQYRPVYEGYGELLRSIAESEHQSCMILTSREKPAEISVFEGIELPVRSLSLSGSLEASQAILQAKGLIGSVEQRQHLCDRYSNVPLALKIVASSIRDIFDSEIAAFLTEDTFVFNGIHRLLEQQFQRLSILEQSVMYWLAIKREPTTFAELHEDIVPAIPKARLLEVLESLQWRSLIESGTGRFTLQPVVMEYVTEKLLGHICEELETQELNLFISHALIEAQEKDYIRESQIRVILEPLAQRLVSKWRSKKEVEYQLKGILFKQRSEFPHSVGYAGGNLLNLLHQLQIDLSGYDFSHLNIWQAYLQDVNLHQVNLAYADLAKSVFTETFGSIHAVAFSPTGQLLATGDANGEIRLMQVADRQHHLTCVGHTNWVHTVAFSPDGQQLASGGTDQTVRLWDVRTGQCLKILQGHTNWVWGVAFSSDGQMLASGSEDKTVKLWDVRTGQCLKTLSKPTNIVRSIAFSPDGQTIASGTAFQAIRIWDVSSGRLLKNLLGHTNWVWSVAFSPDGQMLASGCDDSIVRLWDVRTGQCLKTFLGHSNSLRSVTFSPDGQLLASGSTDQTVRIWDVRTSQCLKILPGHTHWIWTVAFSPDGQILVSGSEDRTVKLWDVRTGQCLKTLSGYSNRISSVAFAPQCNLSSLGIPANSRDSANSSEISLFPQSYQGKVGNRQDVQLLASGSDDRIVRLWDVSSGQYLDLPGHTDAVRTVAFSPNGQILASGSGNHERTIRLWDVKTGQCFNTLHGHSNGIWAVAFHPQGDILASGSDDQTIRLWDVRTGQCLNTLYGHTIWVWSVAFNPQGDILASASTDRTVKLWDLRTGECLNTLQGHTTGVQSIAFSSDGQTIASCSFDRTVRLWDVRTGQCLKILQEHTNPVLAVAFNPTNSQILASGSFDRTIRLWDVRTGECLSILQGHTSGIWTVDFSPDGCWLASAGEDGTIMLWDVKTGECRKTLRAAKPYEGTNITGVTGVTIAQKMTLKALGAMEQ